MFINCQMLVKNPGAREKKLIRNTELKNFSGNSKQATYIDFVVKLISSNENSRVVAMVEK